MSRPSSSCFLHKTEKKQALIYGLAFLSVLFFILAKLIAERPLAIKGEMLRASELMNEATDAVRRCKETRGLIIDRQTDPNATGLIGLETSLITTSLGNLEAKRTTTNPNFAGLLVLLLSEAGAKKGDAVAIGASSSFPALILASLCAAKAVDLKPLLICSLGASQWGANNPEFNWLDIQDCLKEAGLLDTRPLALSLGGEADSGQDMTREGRDFLIGQARRSGIPVLEEPDLQRNVKERLRLYEIAAGERGVKVFINVGGSYANLGTDSEILHIKPGLAEFRNLPGPERRGVVFEMASRGISVIHLLYVKGLSARYGLPWDPLPLPKPGEGEFYGAKRLINGPFLPLGVTYLFLVGLLLFLFILRRGLP